MGKNKKLRTIVFHWSTTHNYNTTTSSIEDERPLFKQTCNDTGFIRIYDTKVFKEVIDLGDGREFSIEPENWAKQGPWFCCCNNLENVCYYVAVVFPNYKQVNVDFLPLNVDYREKFAASVVTLVVSSKKLRPSDGEDYYAFSRS